MKCPLRIFVVQQGLEVGTGYMPDCLKEECAWWDDGSSACAIWSLMSGFHALGNLIREIEQKMPHEGQLRK